MPVLPKITLTATALLCLNFSMMPVDANQTKQAEATKPSVAARAETVEEVIDVAPVWAGHPVGFALLTHGDQQFVAFYDAERHMTVGQRKLGDKSFKLTRLASQVGWDSHNYIALTVDDAGFIHVAGNMHVVPLVYFRSTRPLDASSLERVPQMTGQLEDRVTYPIFFRGPKQELIFTYRDGSSGNGNQIYNLYDPKTRTWRRLLDRPLTDGQGERNAYLSIPRLGPDGFFHMVWVWRESPDASTNHDPSYARSRDLINWENGRGEPLALPITLHTGDIVDRVPVKGGIINGNVHLGFDAQKRPIVSYHKYDEKGNTQLYNARMEGGQWKVYQTSDWDYRWDFGGGGTLIFEVGLGPVQLEADGTLTQYYRNKKHGSGTWILDPQTLKPIGKKAAAPGLPSALTTLESNWPNIEVRRSADSGKSGDANVRYMLRWETLPSNRDRPHPAPWPPASTLRLYKLRRAP
jgi:hypothetical protein